MSAFNIFCILCIVIVILIFWFILYALALGAVKNDDSKTTSASVPEGSGDFSHYDTDCTKRHRAHQQHMQQLQWQMEESVRNMQEIENRSSGHARATSQHLQAVMEDHNRMSFSACEDANQATLSASDTSHDLVFSGNSFDCGSFGNPFF